MKALIRRCEREDFGWRDAPGNERRTLPKRIFLGNLEGAVRRGRCGKEKEWTDCVESDIRAFGIAGDCKARA